VPKKVNMFKEVVPIIKDFLRFIGSSALYLTVCLSVILVIGCSAITGGKSDTSRREGAIKIEKLAVTPLQKVVTPDPAQRFVRCPLSGVFLRSCAIPKGAAKAIEGILLAELKERRDFMLIPPEKVEGVYRRISATSFKDSLREKLQKTGEELGADAVLAGYVYCYIERKGYTYAVEQPASVTFCLHLLRVRDGALLWSGTFDKTQSSLMENLLDATSFFRGGGKWITVRELSREGVEGLLKTFPNVE